MLELERAPKRISLHYGCTIIDNFTITSSIITTEIVEAAREFVEKKVNHPVSLVSSDVIGRNSEDINSFNFKESINQSDNNNNNLISQRDKAVSQEKESQTTLASALDSIERVLALTMKLETRLDEQVEVIDTLKATNITQGNTIANQGNLLSEMTKLSYINRATKGLQDLNEALQLERKLSQPTKTALLQLREYRNGVSHFVRSNDTEPVRRWKLAFIVQQLENLPEDVKEVFNVQYCDNFISNILTCVKSAHLTDVSDLTGTRMSQKDQSVWHTIWNALG